MAGKEKVDVQGYLSKHKVAALFEDLMAKVIKQLPHDPVEFLIRKLQTIHQKQKKPPTSTAPSISPVKAVPAGGKIQVTGTTVASKSAKSPISDRLSKSTSGLRPVKPKTAGLSSPSTSLSKTIPTRSSQTVPTKGATPHRGTLTIPNRGARPGTSSGIPQIRSAVKPKATPPSSRPQSGTRPVTAPEVARGGKSSKLPLKRSGAETGTGGKKKAPSSSASSPRVSKPVQPSGAATPKVKQDREVADAHVKETSAVEIDEFFGEGKKTSLKVHSVEEEEEEVADLGGASESEEEVELDQECVWYGDDSPAECISAISSSLKKGRSRTSHSCKQDDRQQILLDVLQEVKATPLSLGCHDSSESGSDEEECWLEDEDALRDEGVEVAPGSRLVPRHSVATVSGGSEGLLCARCSQALGEAESVVSIQASSVSASDFESASQAGHASFPQWTPEGVQSGESELTSSSQLTIRSEDTWGGLTPTKPPQLHSDEESEVQLPVAMPLQGQAWPTEDHSQQNNNPHGWGQQQ